MNLLVKTHGFTRSPNPYVELQSHLDAHGVKQVFDMLPGTRMNFILRYKGRYDGWEECENAFTLKVEGASEVLIDGTAAEVAGNVRSKSFMETDSGTQWATWHHASVSITAPASASGLKSIKLSLVPITTTSSGEEITRGGFVDLVTMEFKAINDRINYGFDPPMKGLPNADPPVPDDPSEELPWASAVRGRASDNQNVKFILPQSWANKTKLKIVSGSADLNLTPNESPLSAIETNLTLAGLADLNPAMKTIATAQVEAQLVSNSQKLIAMNVMVLPERTVSVGIYRVTDPLNGATGPIHGPTNDEILITLKEVYKQSGITFRLDGSEDREIAYDENQDGKVQGSEVTLIIDALLSEQVKMKVILAKNSGIPYPDDPTSYIRGASNNQSIPRSYGILFVTDCLTSGVDISVAAAHEVGHILDCTVRNPDMGDHDPGPFPLGADGLMKSGAPRNGVLPKPGRWLAHEDWRKANESSEDYE